MGAMSKQYDLERKVNARLKSLPRSKRPAPYPGNPDWPVTRVDYATSGFFEATVAHGHTVFVPAATVKSWLDHNARGLGRKVK